jgi:uncharacterized membrane protein
MAINLTNYSPIFLTMTLFFQKKTQKGLVLLRRAVADKSLELCPLGGQLTNDVCLCFLSENE